MNKLDSPQTFFVMRSRCLQDYQSRIRGYRPDMQTLLFRGKDLYPMRPAIHALIAKLYQTMLNNVSVGEAERSAAENIYSDAKKRVISYVQTKLDHTGSKEKLKSWDVWTKVAGENFDLASGDKLLKASDHIEDTLFLAELSGILQFPPDKTHLHEEIAALTEKLNEYLSLLPAETSQMMRERFLPSIQAIDNLYMQSNYAQELENLKTALNIIRC